jgi:arylsulfatase A-like enzyme
VLDDLQKNGYMDNTLIIFTSDHGDGAAAHRWAAKLSLYEESAKVPLIVAWPGKIPEGKTDSKHLVSLTDILPTMLDYANIQTGLSFTGESLKPLLEGKTNQWRNYTVVELADYQKDPSRKGRMVRTGLYKYNIYSTGEEQLFHFANDPGEKQNLVNDPSFEKTKIQCRQYLKQWAEATADSFAVEVLNL